MTREDLIDYKDTIQWVNARIKFYEEQKRNIGKLVATLSDMPRSTNHIMDKEAEMLAILEDQINELISETSDMAIKKEKQITEQLNKMTNTKERLILYYHFVLGKKIKEIVKEVDSLKYEVKYAYTLKDRALDNFDKLDEHHEKKG